MVEEIINSAPAVKPNHKSPTPAYARDLYSSRNGGSQKSTSALTPERTKLISVITTLTQMNAVKIPKALRQLAVAAIIAFASAFPRLGAQSTPAPLESDRDKPRDAEAEEVITLSPFSVSGEAEEGYQAKTTLAGTRIRAKVEDIGSALQIVTSQFLKDTGATDTQSLLTLTTGTEVGGLYGNFGGNGAGQTVYEWGTLARPDLNTRIRGLTAADNTREFESSDIPWDAYNVDTVEIQRGANSILFGLGSPAGLINASLKQANLRKNGGSLAGRFGKHGSYRITLDANHALLKDELALRVDLLKDYTYFQQKPSFSDDKRLYGALRYDPKFLNNESVTTSLRLSFESGKVKARNPYTMPPVDKITPWFTDLGKRTYNFNYANYYFPDVANSGPMVSTSPNYQPWLTGLYQGSYAIFPDPSSGAQSGPFRAPGMGYVGQQYGLAPNGTIDKSIQGLPTNGLLVITQRQLAAAAAKLPFASAYKNSSLTDPSIFDFYHKSISGPEPLTRQEFDAINLHLSQTYFGNRLGVELAYDKQDHYLNNYNPYNGTDGAITVDVNTVLGDGTPNPNVGRPYITTASYYGASDAGSRRESKRATAFAEFRATDVLRESWLTKIIGRHTLTGVYNETDYRSNSRSAASSAFSPLGATADPDALIGTALDPYRWFQAVSYLGPSLANASSAQGSNLDAVTVGQRPSSTAPLRVFNSRWKPPTNPSATGYVNPAAVWYDPFRRTNSTESENPANYVGWVNLPVDTLYSESDWDSLITSSIKRLSALDSKILVYQGSMFGGNVIPIFGWRKDTSKSYSKTQPTTSYGTVNEQDPTFVLPDKPFNTVTGQTRSYSLVVHTPMFLRRYLPTGMNVSLFGNKSKNFVPASSRVDIMNVPLAPPSGETKDYGVMVSALNGRVSFKVTKFESLSSNSGYDVANAWLAGSLVVRTWVSAKRFEAGLTGNPLYAGSSYNYGTNVNGVFTQTAQDIADQKAAVQATLSSPFITNPAFWEAWKMPIGSQAGMSDYRWQNNYNEPWTAGLGGFLPDGMTATSDNLSEGYEFELYIKPTDNWDITLNASKTTAVQTNIGGASTRAFLEAQNDFFTSAGGRLLRRSGTSTTTWKEQWDSSVWGPWSLSQLLNGTNNAELRPWRFNLITSYRFTQGRLNGFNVGGAYQWQDKIAIGYPSVYATIAGIKSETFDVEHPYWGPSDTNVNLWIGYGKKVARNLNWRIQLNVDNAFGKNKLIPINTQPDGTPAAYRIKVGSTWSVTNTLEF